MTKVDQSNVSFEKHYGTVVLLLSSIYSPTLYVINLETEQFYATRINNIKNATRCRDSRSAKSIETR